VITYEKVQGNYWRDILDQPPAIRDTVAGLASLPELETVRKNLLAGRLRRVVLNGHGWLLPDLASAAPSSGQLRL
jgi:hypothetical protein